ncbi:MAG TPA: CehA/McbA family metallohydrolase [Terriglobales bacterium]|nr:CehA/McbA family metallohydrolase [Terriglobales bacterium]
MTQNRRRFLMDAVGGAYLAGSRGFAANANAVLCRIVEEHSGRALSARVRLTDARGNDVVPLGHPSELAPDAQQGDVRFQSKRFAYVDGSFSVDPNSLPLRYQVIKGYEFIIAEGEISPGELRDGAITIPLSRWSSLAGRGWYGGDIHIHHISPKTCRLEMEAEDLDVANILTSDFTLDQAEFEGGLNGFSSGRRLIYVNQEFRNNHLGHMCLLNLKRLIEPVKTMQPYEYPLHLRACDETRAQGGYVSWAHFPTWPGVESPLDIAMEKLDGLEILCVLDPREFPVFMKQVVPEFEANHGLHLWYRYLNCGFRLAATAGTDKMTTFVTVGANRVFARVDGEFTYQNWINALKQGRTFVTNSPVLTFTVNGRDPGATLQYHSPKDRVAQVHAVAESQLPYDRMEIVASGTVVAQATPSGPRHRSEIHLEYPVERSCWLASRVCEDMTAYRKRGVDFREVHVSQGTRLSDHYGTRRPETVFAHSSPIYVIRDGAPIRNWEDAEYFVRYLDHAIQWLETEARFARAADKKASIQAFVQGRAVYAARAQKR